MSVTAAMLAELRRYIDEPDDSNGYDDDTLTEYVERYPGIDEQGEEPYTLDTSTSPPTQDANEDWIATYDLHAVAALIWPEKAATISDRYDFSADGGQFVRHQAFDQYMQMARYHNARRAPRNLRTHVWPAPTAERDWVVNELEDIE